MAPNREVKFRLVVRLMLFFLSLSLVMSLLPASDETSEASVASAAKLNGAVVRLTPGYSPGSPQPKSLSVDVREWGFNQSQGGPVIRVNKGDVIRITVTNVGYVRHTWTLDANSPSPYDVSTRLLSPGETETLEFVANEVGTFKYYCAVPGHRERGMEGEFVVEVAVPLTVNVDRAEYSPGELVTISGLTAPNIAVAVEVRNPKGTIVFSTAKTSDSQGVFRAAFRLPAGSVEGEYTVAATANSKLATASFTVTAPPFPLTISKLATSDLKLNPRSSFSPGETLLASSTVKNVAATNRSILVSLQVTDPELTPLPTLFIQVTLEPGQEFTFSPSIVIPPDAVSGAWSVEALVFSDFVSKGGIVLAEPIRIAFTVTR